MTEFQKKALVYVSNTNGEATRDHFIEDFKPVGKQLFYEIYDKEWVEESEDGKLLLTDEGENALASN